MTRITYLVAVMAIALFTFGQAAKAQTNDFANERVAKYAQGMARSVGMYKDAKARLCKQAAASARSECYDDFDRAASAVRTEADVGIEYQNSMYRAGTKAPATLELRAKLTRAMQETTRLMQSVSKYDSVESTANNVTK